MNHAGAVENAKNAQNTAPAQTKDTDTGQDEKEILKGQSKGWQTLREWAQTIIIALIIALPIRYFVAEPFIVSGASMDPTFASGQFLVVDRLSYRFEKPQRDAVIVFEFPNNPSVYYIKRIIGLPGETLKINDGKITVINAAHPDGLILDEPFVSPAHASHDTETVTLGQGQYFVMGDNRAQSSDSRAWGNLDAKYIVGRPILRLLPLNKLAIWPGDYEK
ncbi:signal peptidase I [Patescibacteria group bacterium]|nr:signal peptidase I [Patescibacteria group bacterium]MDE1946327.1 signal peptidase I [Patescibacteria group bacterium]MDE2010779.1 signal peptidase I [Patescibacteria group bacterium]MDE2232664.1 signal peptidase I [Patescibacteria group bacterium]